MKRCLIFQSSLKAIWKNERRRTLFSYGGTATGVEEVVEIVDKESTMKKIQKRIILIVLAVIVLIAATALVYVFPMLSMNPMENGKILDTGIYAIKNNSNNLFFIESDDGYIVVDAGSDADKVAQTLNQVSIDALDVKYVLLTHSDYDHVASLNLFSNAQIFISEDELQMVNGQSKRNAFSSNTLPDGIDKEGLTLLADGQELKLGEHTVECIKTPGHTPGSMVYLLDGQYLFTGDAFKVSDNTIDVHPFTMDEEISKESILQLDSVLNRSQLVLTAHYGYYQADTIK